MAMPQRDDLIEEIKRTDLLLEWAVAALLRPHRATTSRATIATPARLSAPFPAFSRFSARVVLALRATRKPPANP